MMRSKTTSAHWVRGVAEALSGQGLDVPALFAQAGLDLQAVQAAEQRCPTDCIAHLWELAAQQSGNPCIGLATGYVPQAGNFEVVGYTMMSSPTLLQALQRLVAYLRIVSDAASLSLLPQGPGQWLCLALSSGGRPTPVQRYQYDLLALLKFFRWITGRALRPLAVAMAYPAVPQHLAAYQAAFDCPMHFEADFNGLLLAQADLEAPLPAHNPELAQVHERIAGSRLEQLEGPRTTLRLQALLAQQLPAGEPRRAQIARQLCMSDHTLQRRLAAEGTHFSLVVEATRRELAQQYLAQPHVSLAQVAYLLGFADPSNLSRACVRWFGQAPGVYRRSLTAGNAAPA